MHGWIAEPELAFAGEHRSLRRTPVLQPACSASQDRRRVRRWRRERRKEPWPERVEVPFFPPPSAAAHDRIAATFIGHSTFLVQIGGLRVLTDPIWSERCSPVSFAGPRRARRPGQSLDALPGVDLLLVSHNHYDHMDLPTLREVRDAVGSAGRDRSAQCAPSGESRHPGSGGTGLVGEHRTGGRAGHLCAGAAFFGADAA